MMAGWILPDVNLKTTCLSLLLLSEVDVGNLILRLCFIVAEFLDGTILWLEHVAGYMYNCSTTSF
jgi:hypothetical protein